MNSQIWDLVKKYIELSNGEFETEDQEYEFNCLAHNIAELMVDEFNKLPTPDATEPYNGYWDRYH